MSREPAPSPAERWKLVNARLREESRSATMDKKFTQLAALMGSVDDFGWREKLEADDERVRELWTRLRVTWSRG